MRCRALAELGCSKKLKDIDVFVIVVSGFALFGASTFFSTPPMVVRFERVLPEPIERVWEFLVDTKRLSGWFGDGMIEPRVGGGVRIMGGHIRGVVARWNPPRTLIYTWNVFSPGDDESSYPESYVSFELEPKGNEVLLMFKHLPVLERFEKQNAMGWHTFLDMLGAAVRGEIREARDSYMKRNAVRYGVDLSNLVR